ncbi:MAG TPA: hypothetical protein VN253_29130 [Kofleriaceae bacterium]|nr:hypothetical protein [Kofleriaceae bacterium]
MAVAKTAQDELIWQGRLHLGDGPGIYGDATYCGLCAELPITVSRFGPNAQQLTLILATSDLETFQGYPGHEITVFAYVPDPKQRLHSVRQVLATERFQGSDRNTKEVVVDVGTGPGPFRLSVRLGADTTVNPGLYNDFVWQRLLLKATNLQFFTTLGFSA